MLLRLETIQCRNPQNASWISQRWKWLDLVFIRWWNSNPLDEAWGHPLLISSQSESKIKRLRKETRLPVSNQRAFLTANKLKACKCNDWPNARLIWQHKD